MTCHAPALCTYLETSLYSYQFSDQYFPFYCSNSFFLINVELVLKMSTYAPSYIEEIWEVTFHKKQLYGHLPTI